MKKYKIISDISAYNKNNLAKRLNEIIKDGWGDFGLEYVESHILTSDFLNLAVEKKTGEIVGFASVRGMPFKGSVIYYLEFTAVDSSMQGNHISTALNTRVIWDLLRGSLKNLKGRFMVMAISPNPRVLGIMSRTSRMIYPDHRGTAEASRDVWEKVNALVKYIGDPYTKIERNQSVIEGFYNDKKDLIYEPTNVPKDKSIEVNDFCKKFLKYEEKRGREFVIYAEYDVWSLLKYGFKNLI